MGEVGKMDAAPLPAVRWMRWVAAVAVAGAVAAAAASFVEPEPGTIVVRLATPTAQVAAAAPAPVAPAGAAGDPVSPVLNESVLGALRVVWTETRGQPSQGVFGDLFAGTTGVRWREDAAGRPRAAQVELLTGAEPVSLDRARELAGRFRPRDAQRVGMSVDGLGQTVEVFRSVALAAAFGEEDGPVARAVFGPEPAGTFVQVVQGRSSRTTRVLLSLGPLR